MSIPTITSISPSSGPTGGHNLVVVTGTNFRVPPTVAAVGPTTPHVSTVLVQFDSEQALRTEVVDSTTIYVLAPPFHGLAVDDPIPKSPITVTNLDDDGIPVPNEHVTLTGAYKYVRPILHSTSANVTAPPTPFALVSAALIMMLRKQVLFNVVQTTHVDYSEPGVLSIAVGKLPGVIIQGPMITRDLQRWHNEVLEIVNDDGTVDLRHPPFVAKLAYTILGVSDNEEELLNMQGSLVECFTAGKYLSVNINPLDSTAGRAELVMELTQPPQTTSAPSDSNIRTWIANVEIRGVEVFLDKIVDHTFPVVETDVDVQKLDGTSVETIVIN